MNSKFVLLLIPLALAGLMFANVVYAGYIQGPAGPLPLFIAEPPPCAACARPCLKHKYHSEKPKRHHLMRHHRKHVKRHCSYAYGSAIPVCVYRYYPQAEIPAFRQGPGSGRFVNLIDCAPYDPDGSTGDDDPANYPGMNIDN